MKVKFVVKAVPNDSTDTLEIEGLEELKPKELDAALDEQLLGYIGNVVDAYWEIVEGDDE